VTGDPAALSAHLDGELTAGEQAELDARLAADETLRRELAEVAEVRTRVRGLGPAAPPPGLLDDVVRAVAAAPVSGVVVGLDVHRRRGRVALAAVAAVAAAAVLAVVVPDRSRSAPSIATAVRTHQAGTAAAGDPVSGLAPLATPMGLGR
jgi:anti-sigma factor RsiW